TLIGSNIVEAAAAPGACLAWTSVLRISARLSWPPARGLRITQGGMPAGARCSLGWCHGVPTLKCEVDHSAFRVVLDGEKNCCGRSTLSSVRRAPPRWDD